jgi:cell division protein FtsL
MQQRIHQLEAQLRGQESINGDLIKRIKMLEFSLRQERVKYAKLANGGGAANVDIIGPIV